MTARRASAAVLVVVAALGASNAYAAFPGRNGLITYSRLEPPDRTESVDEDVFVVAPDGAGLRNVSVANDHVREFEPTWSPDGRTLAYGCEDDHDQAWLIWRIDVDGSNRAPLTKPQPGSFSDEYPAWSPDGRSIAFIRHHPGETIGGSQSDIYVMAADGSNVRRLTTTAEYFEGELAWAQDGRLIAYVRGTHNAHGGEIWVMNADGSGHRQLIAPQQGVPPVQNIAGSPDWSPDGSKIVFDRAANSQIWVANADGTAPRHIAGDTEFQAKHPVWSPDGSRIAFVRGFSDRNLVTANPDGTQERVVATGESGLTRLNWGSAPTIATRVRCPPDRACGDRLTGSWDDDDIRGTSRGERILAGAGDDRVAGLGGHDCLLGNDGADTLQGGDGSDQLFGGRGRDTLVGGGSSRDHIHGGGGDDLVRARDGARDLIWCGAGRDIVLADRRDGVVGGCERVRRR